MQAGNSFTLITRNETGILVYADQIRNAGECNRNKKEVSSDVNNAIADISISVQLKNI